VEGRGEEPTKLWDCQSQCRTRARMQCMMRPHGTQRSTHDTIDNCCQDAALTRGVSLCSAKCTGQTGEDRLDRLIAVSLKLLMKCRFGLSVSSAYPW
jgi:hypothetical protein